LPAVRSAVERLRFLVSKDAELRPSLELAQAQMQALEFRQAELAVSYSGTAADARAQVDALALEVRQFQEKRTRAATVQGVRSPLAGTVAEIRVKDATQAGVSVELVIISEVLDERN
jgi:20S proteasome alpha/beta subunit